MLRPDGRAFSLTRQYELLHENSEEIGRHRIDALLPLAKQSESSWSPTGRGQIPAWARRSNGENSYYCKGFTAYWFIDQYEKGHDAVKKAWETPSFGKGVTYHFDKVKTISDAVSEAKGEQRREMVKHYREEFGCRKPFFTNGEIRFYVSHPSLQEELTDWNDRWVTEMAFSKKALDRCIDSVKRFLEQENLSGSFAISLEGQYSAAVTMEEHKDMCHVPWGDYWEVNNVATVTV